MTATITFVVVIIVIALIFDYINGFHDAANSIATVVSTRVLSPGAAVVWAAFFNFIAFLVLGEAVAKTIGKDMVDIHAISEGWQLWVLLSDRKSTRLNSSHANISYAVFCLKKTTTQALTQASRFARLSAW